MYREKFRLLRFFGQIARILRQVELVALAKIFLPRLRVEGGTETVDAPWRTNAFNDFPLKLPVSPLSDIVSLAIYLPRTAFRISRYPTE